MRTDLNGAVTVDASPDRMTVQTVHARSAPIKIIVPVR
jgi:hypothetical protein